LQLSLLQPSTVTTQATPAYPKLLGSLRHFQLSFSTHNTWTKISSLAYSRTAHPIKTHLSNILFFTTQQPSLSSATPYHTNQPHVNPLYIGRHSFKNHLLNSKLESIRFLLQCHFYGTLFQTRCASPLLMIYLYVYLSLVDLSISVAKLISSPSHI